MVCQENESYIASTLGVTTGNSLRKAIYLLVLLTILFSIGSSAGQSETQSAFLGITDILDAWEASYGAIHTMKVKYSETLSGLTDPNRSDNIMHTTVERIQDGKRFHIERSISRPGLPRSDSNVQAAFDGDTSSFCDHRNKLGTIEPGIATKGLESYNSLEQYMWLSRYYHNPDYPDGETYLTFWIRNRLAESRVNENVRVSVRPELENVLGEPCHVVETVRGDRGRRFWIAHGKGMLPMKFERFIGQEVVNSIVAHKIAKTMTDIGEVWYPSNVERVAVNAKDGKVHTYRCKVQEFVPHIDDIAPGTFRVRFPDGIMINDKVAGIRYVKGDTTHALEGLETKIGSSQVPLEPNRPRDALNSKATNETPGDPNVRSEEPESGRIVGDTQWRTRREYGYVLVACLALIVPIGILLYRRSRLIKKN